MSTAADLDALTSGQWGLLTAAQAMRVGVSRMQLSREVTSGRLERLLAGVYRDSGVPVDPRQGIRALWLAGDPARTAEERLDDGAGGIVIGGATAAYLHGIGDLQPEPVELYSPTRRQTERPGVRYRIRRLEDRDVTLTDGLPVTGVERTLADLVADRHDLSLVVDALRDAVRAGPLDLDRLASLLDPSASRLDRPSGAALLDGLADSGRIELRPPRSGDEVRQRWLQQVVQMALPDVDPLRRTMIAELLEAARLQETVAAAIRSSALDTAVHAAAAAAPAPAVAARTGALEQQLQEQVGRHVTTQAIGPTIAPALRAAGVLPQRPLQGPPAEEA